MAVRGKRAPRQPGTGGQTGPVIEIVDEELRDSGSRQPLEMANLTGEEREFPEEGGEIGRSRPVVSASSLMGEMKERLQEGTERVKGTPSAEPPPPDPKEPFPHPPSSYVIDKPERFFEYWRNLPQHLLDRAVVYVYRVHPVINKLICPQCGSLQEPKKGTSPYRCLKCSWSGYLTKYIDKLANPIELRTVLANYGCGQYEFTLIDSGRSVTVMKARVTTVTDYSAYPPMMEDYRHVDVHAPSNKSYVQWARMKGIKFPQLADETEKEEEEMAKLQTEMITPLTQTIERMTDKMMEDRNKPAPASPGAKSADEALAAGIRLMADASAKGQEIIAKGYEQASAIRQDPMEGVKGVFSLLKDSGLIGGKQAQPAGTEVVQQIVPLINNMMSREADIMKAQMEMNGATIRELHAKTANLEQRIFELLSKERRENAPPTIAEKLEEWEKMKKLFGGGKAGEDSEEKPAWERILEKALPVLLMALPAIIAGRANSGAPGASGVPGLPGPSITGPNPPGPGDGSNTTYQSNPQTAQPHPNNPGEPAVFDLQQQFVETFRQLEPRIVEELKKDYPDGIDFARGFRQWVPMGVMKYHMLRNQAGADVIKGALEMYGSEELKALIAMDRPRFEKFLWEFLNPEEAEERYAQEEEEQEQNQEQADKEIAAKKPV